MIARLLAALMLLAAWAPLPATAKAFQSDKISVETVGRGSDVVLVHGLSSSRDVWRQLVRDVPNHRYHLVQINGFAGTPAGGNAGTGALVAPVADEIARYIAASGLRRPALIGHSMGGSIGLMVAARHPTSIARLMVVDMVPFMGAFFGNPSATAEELRPMATQMRDRMATASAEARRPQMEATIATMVKTEALRAAPVEHGMASDPAVSARGMYDLITTDLRPELGRIQVPVTVLYVRSPALPITDEQMDAFYKAAFAGVPEATLTRVPDSYHFIMFDQPARFAAEVRRFLPGS